MSDVFISYSRTEGVFADKLASALEKDDRIVWIDRARIELTSEWWEEIKRGIEASDNFVLIMSPASMASPVCHLEIEYARQLTKRIIPIYHIAHDYEGTKEHFGGRLYKNDKDGFLLKLYGDRNPMLVFEENWNIIPGINRIEAPIKTIESDPKGIPTKIDEADFQTFFPSLRKALDTDIEHVHQQTYLFNRTRDWLKKGRKTSDLLNGVETQEAEEWLQNWETDKANRQARGLPAKDPQPNDDIRAYIIASREAEKRRKRLLRNLRVGTLTFAVVGVIATVLAISSFISLQDTQGRADIASTRVAGVEPTLNAAEATLSFVNEQIERSEARIESLRLASEAINIVNNPHGNSETATLLGIVALRTAYTPQSDAALVQALDQVFIERRLGDHINSYGYGSRVNSVAFSPDGQYVLSGSSDNTMILWDVETGERIHTFSGHTNTVSSVVFSPDGQYVLSGSSDNTMVLWDVETGEHIRTFSGHTNTVNSVAFSPDGQYVLSGSSDNTMVLWDVETGEDIRTFSDHTGYINSVAFSPDGQYVLSGSLDNTMILWDMGSGERIRAFHIYIGGFNSVTFSPDSRYILSGSHNGNLRLWDVESGEHIRTFSGVTWDMETGERIRTFSGHTSAVYSVAFSPDGQYVLSGSSDNTMVLWDVETGERIRTFSGHTSTIYSVAFSSDGQHIVSGSDDGTLILWTTESHTLDRRFSHDLGNGISVFSPNGHFIASAAGINLLIWDVDTREIIQTFSRHNNGVVSIAFSPDNRHLVSGSTDKSVIIWGVQTGQVIHRFYEHTSSVDSVAFSPDGHYVLSSGSYDRTLILWDVETGERIRTFSGHNERVTSVGFSPDGNYVLSGSSDNTLRLWDVETGETIRIFSGHTNFVQSVAFSPDGSYVLSGSSDNTLRLWDVETGETIRIFSGHINWVHSVVFSPDGRYVLSGSSDNTMQLWDVETEETIRIFSGHAGIIYTVAFSPDGRYVLSGSSDGTMRLWDTDYRDFLIYSCTRVSRDFTEDERQQYGITDNEPTCPQFASN